MNFVKLIFVNSSVFFLLIISIEFSYYIYKFTTNNLFNNDNYLTKIKECMDFSKVPIFDSRCKEINSYGARGIEVKNNYKYSKTALALGESISFGFGANYDETWTENINYKYGEKDLFLYNFGIPSTTIKHSKEYYSKLFDLIDHDYVVIFTGWNDLHSMLLSQKFKYFIIIRLI